MNVCVKCNNICIVLKKETFPDHASEILANKFLIHLQMRFMSLVYLYSQIQTCTIYLFRISQI